MIKSLVLTVLAAFLGPAIGIGAFLVLNAY